MEKYTVHDNTCLPGMDSISTKIKEIKIGEEDNKFL